MSDPAARDARPSDLLPLFEEAAEGLVYSSESDRPFHPFFLPAERVPNPLTPATLAPLVGAPADGPTAESSLDDFFFRHIECVEPVDRLAWERLPRYDALKRLLRERLRNPRVFRFGRVAIRCLVVGGDADGNLVGLETVAVET